ncbi:hypothetical protein COLO4_02409 [Corchorus olitorius]|uniref:Uncharacterized protein n=1 Tax=Corchorus olitorius TaxID=93759 RepID=A0A1R3L142_9ROSI|nr:hypothetical protein COLO4_02409 [Corchorus olitorius]
MQLEVEAGPQDVVTEEARSARLFQCLFEDLVFVPDLAVDVVVAHGDAHRVAADGHAFDQRVRVVPDDVAILERARLAFVRVANEILLARKLTRHEAPLQARGEACTATAAEARGLHVGNDLLGGDLLSEDAFQLLIAATLDVIFEVPVVAVQTGENQRLDMSIVQGGHLLACSVGRRLRLEVGDQRVELLVAHEAAHVGVVDDHDRCITARAHAFAFLQREVAVGGGLVETDAQLLLQVVGSTFAARQRARQVRAHRQFESANRLGVVHVVERRHFLDPHRRHFEVLGHELHDFGRDPAFLALRDRQRRHHGGLLLVGGIFRDRPVDFLESFC